MPKPVILLVEDNEDDAFLMRRALKKTEMDCPLQIAEDGQQALDYLAGNGAYQDRAAHPLPSIVFLDLKLPRIHGFEVLEWIRAQPHFKNLEVVILTSSGEERDKRKALELTACAYLVKPPTSESLHAILNTHVAAMEQNPVPLGV